MYTCPVVWGRAKRSWLGSKKAFWRFPRVEALGLFCQFSRTDTPLLCSEACWGVTILSSLHPCGMVHLPLPFRESRDGCWCMNSSMFLITKNNLTSFLMTIWKLSSKKKKKGEYIPLFSLWLFTFAVAWPPLLPGMACISFFSLTLLVFHIQECCPYAARHCYVICLWAERTFPALVAWIVKSQWNIYLQRPKIICELEGQPVLCWHVSGRDGKSLSVGILLVSFRLKAWNKRLIISHPKLLALRAVLALTSYVTGTPHVIVQIPLHLSYEASGLVWSIICFTAVSVIVLAHLFFCSCSTANLEKTGLSNQLIWTDRTSEKVFFLKKPKTLPKSPKQKKPSW